MNLRRAVPFGGIRRFDGFVDAFRKHCFALPPDIVQTAVSVALIV